MLVEAHLSYYASVAHVRMGVKLQKWM